MLAAFTVGRERGASTSWWGPALTVGLPWAWFAVTTGSFSSLLALTPQPGLEQVGRLVEQLRSTGVGVDLVVEGTSTPLPPGPDLVAYRIVQEA